MPKNDSTPTGYQRLRAVLLDRNVIRLAIRWSVGALRLLCAMSAVLLVTIAGAAACAICFTGRVVTIGQQLDAADQAALAVPEGERFRIVEVVKGNAAVGGIIAEQVFRVDPDALRSGKPLLLLRNARANVGRASAASVPNMPTGFGSWPRRRSMRPAAGGGPLGH